MSDDKKTAKAAKQDGTAEKLAVRVKVLKGGLQIGGSTAAVGAILRCYKDSADYHEGRGEVEILGT
jgi:hypothetical protein